MKPQFPYTSVYQFVFWLVRPGKQVQFVQSKNVPRIRGFLVSSQYWNQDGLMFCNPNGGWRKKSWEWKFSSSRRAWVVEGLGHSRWWTSWPVRSWTMWSPALDKGLCATGPLSPPSLVTSPTLPATLLVIISYAESPAFKESTVNWGSQILSREAPSLREASSGSEGERMQSTHWVGEGDVR